jgi:hypothetical protein
MLAQERKLMVVWLLILVVSWKNKKVSLFLILIREIVTDGNYFVVKVDE